MTLMKSPRALLILLPLVLCYAIQTCWATKCDCNSLDTSSFDDCVNFTKNCLVKNCSDSRRKKHDGEHTCYLQCLSNHWPGTRNSNFERPIREFEDYCNGNNRYLGRIRTLGRGNEDDENDGDEKYEKYDEYDEYNGDEEDSEGDEHDEDDEYDENEEEEDMGGGRLTITVYVNENDGEERNYGERDSITHRRSDAHKPTRTTYHTTTTALQTVNTFTVIVTAHETQTTVMTVVPEKSVPTTGVTTDNSEENDRDHHEPKSSGTSCQFSIRWLGPTIATLLLLSY